MIRRAVLIVLGLIWLGPTYLLLVNASRPSGLLRPVAGVGAAGGLLAGDQLPARAGQRRPGRQPGQHRALQRRLARAGRARRRAG
ncbi:hypothetical protein ACFSTC_60925 [Nonomuraea ferruginea]